MTETTEGNGADRPRAQTNTERVRKHRAKKREAATLQEELQRVEAERNAALKAEAEREALQAALQRAERAEREVAERLKADVTEAVTSGEGDGGNVPAPVKQLDAPMVEKAAGVPAVSPPVEWRIVERPPVWHPTVIWHSAQLPAVPDAKPPAPAPAPDRVPALIERPRWRIMSWRTMPAERPVERNLVIRACNMVSALGMAVVSAGFSIFGFTIVFGGAFWSVIAMGCCLEACKLSGVAWLGTDRGSRLLRKSVWVLVGILMTLNAAGCFGFLARAHIGHEVEGETVVAARIADIDGRIAVQSATLADIDRRLGQIDGAIEKAMAQGKVNGAMALAGDQRRNRTDLQVERMAVGKILAELKTERARIDGERRVVEADLGPAKYLAAIVAANDETVLRYFILVLAMLLDPAAVLLLRCATAPPRTAPRSRGGLLSAWWRRRRWRARS
jgi:hypothetical protein